jgi:hypothetical protein
VVARSLHNAQIPLRPPHGHRRFDAHTEEVADRYTRAGQSIAEITAATGLRPGTVKNLLMRAGVPRRRSGPRPRTRTA